LGATMPLAAAKYLWISSNTYSFLNPTGFNTWWIRAMAGYQEDAGVFATLAGAHTGLTEAHIHLVVAWLNTIQANSVVLNVANKEWVSMNASTLSKSLGFGVGAYTGGEKHSRRHHTSTLMLLHTLVCTHIYALIILHMHSYICTP
jgi:hypothetical protein